MAGHTHTLALQDISLKRFRLRYSTASDCYYLHWDQTVCPPLARITGLATGATNVTGLTRYTDQESKMSYLGLSDGAMEGEIEWTLDFSHSGLAVKKMLLKAGSVAGEEEGTQITHVLTGDGKKVANSSHYGITLGSLVSFTVQDCRSVSNVWPFRCLHQDHTQPHLQGRCAPFPARGDGDVCPLDVTVELMVPRNADVYIGEILLGLKYCPQRLPDGSYVPFQSSDDSSSSLCQLQVHIVEGAGDMHAVLPESEHSCSPKQTSPRHNVYPTWTKEFVFPGLSRATLSEGGLEVILYDHHRLHRVNIGGIRLCVPRLKEPSPVLTQKSFQRDGSVILFGQAMKDGAAPHSSHGASKPGLPPISPLVNFSPSSNSPLLQRRDLSIPKLASSSPQLSPRLTLDLAKELTKEFPPFFQKIARCVLEESSVFVVKQIHQSRERHRLLVLVDGLHTHRSATLERHVGEGEGVGVLLAPAQTQATASIHHMKMFKLKGSSLVGGNHSA
eukprot:Em0010g220a